MNGHVFECYFEQGDKRQYARTVEALEGYAKKNLKFSEDFASLFAFEASEPAIEKPSDLEPGYSTTDEMIWKEEIKAYVNRLGVLRGNLAAIFAVALGQCSEAMKAKLKSLKEFEARSKKNDCHWLLKNILSITLQFDQKRNGYLAIMDAHQNFLTCKQTTEQTTEEYLENLTLWADTIEYHGGTFVENYHLAGTHNTDGSPRTEDERRSAARDETLAMALIRGADPSRFGTLIAELSNQFARGRNEYPTDLNSAYSLLVNYRTPTNTRPRNSTGSDNANSQRTSQTSPASEESAMTFAQQSTPAVGSQGGHTSAQSSTDPTTVTPAPNSSAVSVNTGTTLVQYAVMMAQSNAQSIDPNWVLLDSQSTISVFRNKNMLRNIRRSPHVLRAITNGGYQDSHMIGDFPNLGPVWYNKDSIANILSLSEVRRVCTVTMDTSKEPAMNVHRKDGTIMSFIEHPSGLYVYNGNDVTSDAVNAYTLLNTVAEHKRMFSQRQIAAADAARALYRKIGRPDESEFQSILRGNFIRNCPVTPDDASRALLIYGPDVAVLKGKMTRSRASPRAPTFEAVPIPAPLLQHQRNVTLCVDFFFVQGIGFLHTISRGIGFRTVAPIVDRSHKTILKELSTVISVYQARGLVVQDIHADNEFECIRHDVRPVALNIVPSDSHVGEVERSIRTIKDRLRSAVHGLPFKRYPKLMIRHLVSDAVRCLNQFPRKNGVSDTMSPATIVMGIGTPDFTAMRIEFGAYAQVFEEFDPTNTPRARSLGAIALTPTGNAQGDYHFMSLATGARISRHRWTELPIPDTAIARVEALAIADGQPLIQATGFVVEWRPDHPIDDDAYDFDFHPSPDQAADDTLDDDYVPIEADELAALAAPEYDPATLPAVQDQGAVMTAADVNEYVEEPEESAEDDAEDEDYTGDYTDDAEDDQDDAEDDQNDNQDDDPVEAYDPNETNDGDAVDHERGGAMGEQFLEPIEEHMVQEEEPETIGTLEPRVNQGADEMAEAQGVIGIPSPTSHPYNLRHRGTTPSNDFRVAIDEPHNSKSYFPPRHQMHQIGHIRIRDPQRFAFDYVFAHMSAFLFTQMSAKAAIKKHGKAAEAALMREFGQMEDLDVYEPVHARTLTKEQRKGALRALPLVSEKRCGTLKGRTVADGRPQRNLYDKSETASPTVSNDGLTLTIVADAYEGRDVGTADVAGAYLKAYMKDFVIMKFTGEMVDILCKMNPKYIDYVVLEAGVRTLYVRLIKAIYGCVQSALLWYELFSETLQKMGFVLNPYDRCVANCDINGKQCTIAWYVDDTKISHVDPEVVTMIINKLEAAFGKMTVTRGSSHVFLGMNIDYNKSERTAKITMKDYLREAIIESGLAISKTASTPASKELFEVDDASPALPKRYGDVFHSVVAKLLYVSIRARMDLLLSTSFLTTRVSRSTRQDMGKLKRLLEYINGTIDLEYTVGADDLGRMRTWVDAAYAVHADMRSHTGGVISFGRGGIACKSSKQKLNTKSSTEAEFVGASDYLPNTIWVKMFMEAQGYKINESILEQDNESAIKLEKNGRTSAGPKSRHIHIRYFWLKDRLKSENISVRHCPTLQMLADFFTKPLQGNLFRRFRDVVLGRCHTNTLASVNDGPLEERVRSMQSDPIATVDSSNGTVVRANEEKEIHSQTHVTWADVVKRKRVTRAIKPNHMSLKSRILLK